MKKLAIICPKPPWFNEGQARVVKEHGLRLGKNFDLEIFCCDPSGKEVGMRDWNNIKVHVYKGYSKDYLFSLKLFNDLRKMEFDIVHSHGFTTFLPLAACFVKAKRRIFQPHFHPRGSTGLLNMLRSIYDPIFGRFIVNKSHKIFCVSKYESEELLKKYNIKDKIKVIYDGIDYNSFKKAKPFKTNRKIILYVGRLEKYKNVHLLINSMAHLNDYDLVIIGNGNYKNNLIELVKKLKLNNVKILDKVSDSDTRRWYKTCKVFVTLSEIESFGLTVVEALASGKPVIVNDCMSLSELADKFKEVTRVKAKQISDRELAEVIKKNINKKVNVNLSDFNWDNIVKKMIGEYDR